MSPLEKPNLNVNVSGFKSAVVNFIVPLICIGASAIVGVLLLIPAVKNKPILLSELEESNALNAQLKNKKSVLNDLIDFRSVVEENGEIMDRALVSEALVPELLAQISIIAQESGFEITRLSYAYGGASGAVPTAPSGTSPSSEVGDYESVMVSLGVRGSYDQLTTFLSSVENAIRLVSVENYRFSRDKDGILDVTVILTSPYLFVQSSAVTDDGITLDITSPEFISLLNEVKGMRFYNITPEDISQLLVEESTEEDSVEETLEGAGDFEQPSEVEVSVEEVVEEGAGGTPFDFEEQ